MEHVDDELVLPDLMHRGVKLLDSYFHSACEMDFGFNLKKAFFLGMRFRWGDEIQDSFRERVLKAGRQADQLQAEEERSCWRWLV